MPKQTLQEQTADALTEHQIELNKYGISQRRETMKKINNLLIDIRTALLSGPSEVSRVDLRNMMRLSNKLFKEGMKEIRKNTSDELFALLAVELEEQTKLLQKLLDDYEVEYEVREPSYALAKRNLLDTPLEDQTFETWFDLWELKTNRKIQTELFSESTDSDGQDRDRAGIVGAVFGTGKNPFDFRTFSRPNADMSGLLISTVDGVNSVSSDMIAEANPGIIEGIVWNSVLDSTTCVRCASLHSSTRYFNGPDETDGNEIPLHPNCLCFWTYKYKDVKKMDAKVPLNARRDINSNEPQKKFPMWYNSISDKRKKELFGATRYRMLESGEVTVNQLLSKSNRRLYTLDELKQKGYRVPEI